MCTQRDFFTRTPQTANWQLLGSWPPKSKGPSGNWFGYPSPVNRCARDGAGTAFCRSNQFNPQLNSLNSKLFGKGKKNNQPTRTQQQHKTHQLASSICKNNQRAASSGGCHHRHVPRGLVAAAPVLCCSSHHVLDSRKPPDRLQGCSQHPTSTWYHSAPKTRLGRGWSAKCRAEHQLPTQGESLTPCSAHRLQGGSPPWGCWWDPAPGKVESMGVPKAPGESRTGGSIETQNVIINYTN